MICTSSTTELTIRFDLSLGLTAAASFEFNLVRRADPA